MKKKFKYFYLHPACLPVLGYSRAIIIDTQRNDFIISPKKIASLLKNGLPLLINEIDNETIEYFKELVELEYGFFSEKELSIFPVSSKQFFSNPIANAIIDMDKNSSYDWESFINFIDKNGCEAIKLRYYTHLNLTIFENLMNRINDSSIRFLEISVIYSENIEHIIENAINHFFKIMKITIYNSPKQYVKNINDVIIISLEENLKNEKHCGFVSPTFFSPNMQFINESKNVNNCLNKKISIDKEGNIKNCPASEKIVCNIDEIDNHDVLYIINSLPETKIIKDEIDVCKDCEFRYICSDCRVFTEKNKIYSKPSKCSYDPYTCTWA